MKDEKKLSELEPTISDVLEAVQAGFVRLETGFDRHEGLLTILQTGFERHEKILNTLVAGQVNLTERVNVIDQRLTATQSRVEDVADMLENMTEVVDENRDVLFKHESRIAALEKLVA